MSVHDLRGANVARGITRNDGLVELALAPGSYVVTSAPVPGFSEIARPASVEVRLAELARVVLTHNTGFQ